MITDKIRKHAINPFYSCAPEQLVNEVKDIESMFIHLGKIDPNSRLGEFRGYHKYTPHFHIFRMQRMSIEEQAEEPLKYHNPNILDMGEYLVMLGVFNKMDLFCQESEMTEEQIDEFWFKTF